MKTGLFAWLLRGASGAQRWCSALEASTMMGFPGSVWIPTKEPVATKLIGNAISPYHAGFLSSESFGGIDFA